MNLIGRDRVRLEMYAARLNRGAAITRQRFEGLCKEVRQEGKQTGRLRAFLIKLRAELGYLYPHITSPGTFDRFVGLTDVDEIYRLTGKYMNPPFDIEEAINEGLSCKGVRGYSSAAAESANTEELTGEARRHGDL